MANVSGVTIDTNSITTVINNIRQHESKLKQAIKILTGVGAKKMENWAKTNAKWVDRTGNARQGITGEADWISDAKIQIALSYSVHYGIWLELAMERRFSILEDAIEQNKDELITAYKRLMG